MQYPTRSPSLFCKRWNWRSPLWSVVGKMNFPSFRRSFRTNYADHDLHRQHPPACSFHSTETHKSISEIHNTPQVSTRYPKKEGRMSVNLSLILLIPSKFALMERSLRSSDWFEISLCLWRLSCSSLIGNDF